MAFEASKKEWSELYSFLRLLSDGHVCAGTPSGEVCVERPWKVVVVQREEHDGTRRYLIDSENVRIGRKDGQGRAENLFCVSC